MHPWTSTEAGNAFDGRMRRCFMNEETRTKPLTSVCDYGPICNDPCGPAFIFGPMHRSCLVAVVDTASCDYSIER